MSTASYDQHTVYLHPLLEKHKKGLGITYEDLQSSWMKLQQFCRDQSSIDTKKQSTTSNNVISPITSLHSTHQALLQSYNQAAKEYYTNFLTSYKPPTPSKINITLSSSSSEYVNTTMSKIVLNLDEWKVEKPMIEEWFFIPLRKLLMKAYEDALNNESRDLENNQHEQNKSNGVFECVIQPLPLKHVAITPATNTITDLNKKCIKPSDTSLSKITSSVHSSSLKIKTVHRDGEGPKVERGKAKVEHDQDETGSQHDTETDIDSQGNEEDQDYNEQGGLEGEGENIEEDDDVDDNLPENDVQVDEVDDENSFGASYTTNSTNASATSNSNQRKALEENEQKGGHNLRKRPLAKSHNKTATSGASKRTRQRLQQANQQSQGQGGSNNIHGGQTNIGKKKKQPNTATNGGKRKKAGLTRTRRARGRGRGGK